MPTLPYLTEDDVEAYIPDPYFERGRNYYHNGQIFDTVRRGQQIEGYCEGSAPEPYHIVITLDDDRITGDSCSCPMGGGCKHVAALLLAWAHKPKTFVKRQPVGSALKDKTKEELAGLVQEMLKREPDLERLIDLPTPGPKGKRRTPVSAETYRRQIRYALRSADDWHGVRNAANEIGAVVDIGDGFADQEDWENAQVVYQAVLDEALPEYLNTGDEGDIGGEIGRAVEGLIECLAARAADDKARRALCQALFEVLEWDIEEAGGVGLSDSVPDALRKHATPDDQPEIRKWIAEAIKHSRGTEWSQNYHREAWGRLLASFTDAEDFLKQARKLGTYRPLFEKLVELGRIDEALEAAQKHLTTSGWEILKTAEALAAAKQTEAAIAFAETNLSKSDDDRVPEWLADQYAKRKDYSKALALQMTRWQKRPSLELYKTIASLAQRLKQWDTLRLELLAVLRQKKDYALLTQTYLEEQDWDTAWDTLAICKTSSPWGWRQLAVEVAKAIEKHRPARAISVYLETAEQLIGQKSRQNYAEAARYLRRARDLFTASKRATEWQTFIADLRERHRGLPALQDELKKAKL